MASTIDILADGFSRIQEGVLEVLDGISDQTLSWRPDAEANSIAWLVWHLTRIQDDHLAKGFDRPQAWHEDGWCERFALPFPADATGYGQSASEVGQVGSNAELLRGYHQAVYDRTREWLTELSESDLDRIVDRRWDPPVTLAVRLVSVITDDLEHVGQAAYVRGMAEQA
jgi:uncharacterized damage-inducible protein DinB